MSHILLLQTVTTFSLLLLVFTSPFSDKGSSNLDFIRNRHLQTLDRRSAKDVYLGLCTEDEYTDWYLHTYPPECQTQFNNASTLHQLFEVYCDPFCGDIYFDYLDDCGDVGLVLTTFYTNLCLENEQGVQCYNYFTSNVHYNPKPEAEEYCLPANDTCSLECHYALEAMSVKLGCCANVLYNQSIPDPVVDYDLWEKCDVPTPSFCSNFDEPELSGSPCLPCSVNLVSIATILLLLAILK